MKASVHCVLNTNDSNVASNSRGKEELLPGATEIAGTLYHSHPVSAVQ